MNAPTCKACGQPIFWAKTSKGKLVPIDHMEARQYEVLVELVDSGPVRVVIDIDGTVVRGALRHPDQDGAICKRVWGFLSHRETCPKAHEPKRKRKSERVGK